eukprot:TRINITY_DN8222_c0_g1_i5.p2 TRINITY_DN8222_c0_g1~~TRINITY_DN8222_c0_g1_i5.p2  ORF type:complete len:118 (-),score=27.89 TRINITY_DN8222_c0_g1_i5:413-766(-)
MGSSGINAEYGVDKLVSVRMAISIPLLFRYLNILNLLASVSIDATLITAMGSIHSFFHTGFSFPTATAIGVSARSSPRMVRVFCLFIHQSVPSSQASSFFFLFFHTDLLCLCSLSFL